PSESHGIRYMTDNVESSYSRGSDNRVIQGKRETIVNLDPQISGRFIRLHRMNGVCRCLHDARYRPLRRIAVRDRPGAVDSGTQPRGLEACSHQLVASRVRMHLPHRGHTVSDKHKAEILVALIVIRVPPFLRLLVGGPP